MTTRADAFDLQAAMTAPRQTPRPRAIPADGDYDIAINAESRTYRDGDDLISILSVHTLVCPLIRAELRGQTSVRVLAYYHAGTRLGLQAYEAQLRDGEAVQLRLGLRRFVQETLKLDDTHVHLHDPSIREMYLHEVLRGLSHAIAACRLQSDDEFLLTRII